MTRDTDLAPSDPENPTFRTLVSLPAGLGMPLAEGLGVSFNSPSDTQRNIRIFWPLTEDLTIEHEDGQTEVRPKVVLGAGQTSLTLPLEDVKALRVKDYELIPSVNEASGKLDVTVISPVQLIWGTLVPELDLMSKLSGTTLYEGKGHGTTVSTQSTSKHHASR